MSRSIRDVAKRNACQAINHAIGAGENLLLLYSMFKDTHPAETAKLAALIQGVDVIQRGIEQFSKDAWDLDAAALQTYS